MLKDGKVEGKRGGNKEGIGGGWDRKEEED